MSSVHVVTATAWVQGLGKGELMSPFFDEKDQLYVITQKSGDILSVNSFGQASKFMNTGGAPQSGVFDSDNGRLLVADFAHGAVLALSLDGGSQETLVGVYEDRPLRGPHSLVITPFGIVFSDSGALGETGLHSPTGSLFAITSGNRGSAPMLKPLSLSNLASPAGIAASGKLVYVAETMTNRVLRFFQQPEGVYHGSVFHQLSGGIGPVALAVDAQGSLYVGVTDTKDCGAGGRVLVISNVGVHVGTIVTPGPEISGLAISGNVLYVTEKSQGCIFKVPL
jgi:sugar lactone lactonase YvrE